MRRFVSLAVLSLVAFFLSAPLPFSQARAAVSAEESRAARAVFDRLQHGQGHTVRVSRGGEPYILAPGQIITFDYTGYCMDANLPAPKDNEALAFRPITNFIAPSLVELYRQIMRLDGAAQSDGADVQNIVWGFRAPKAKAGQRERALLDKARPGGANLYATASRGTFVSGSKGGAGSSRAGSGNEALARLFGQMLGDFSRPSRDLMRALNDMGVEGPIPSAEQRYSLLTTQVAGYAQGKGGLKVHGMVANGSDAPYVFDPTLWALESPRPVQRVALPLFSQAKLNSPPLPEQARGQNARPAQQEMPGQQEKKDKSAPSAGSGGPGEAYEFQMRPSPPE